MTVEKSEQSGLKSFPIVYWVSIFFEFMERGAYYGVMSILSVYLVTSVQDGGLGFDKSSVGVIKSTIQPIIYALPILSGALADRFGYKKALLTAFSFLGLGYMLVSQSHGYAVVMASLVVMAIGAGTFKPVISGTIAKTTGEHNSTLGFGIFYWTINLGAFLFPLILVPAMKGLGWQYVFIASGIATGILIIPCLAFYKEPPRPENTKSIAQILGDAVMVLKDVKFVSLILIYSGFWILYFQMFDTVLWYLKDHMDMTPVNMFINSILTSIGINMQFKFDAEHVTVINAGTIITLQLIISNITKKTKPLPTMIIGILMGTIGMAILSISTYAWVFVGGIILFSVGEMTAHPKFLSYVGLIAPKDKVATYMGYSFLYGVVGSGIGGILGAKSYVHFIDNLHNPSALWLMFSCIGVATIVGLILYNTFVATKTKTKENGES